MESKKFTVRTDTYNAMGGALIIPVPAEVSQYFLDAKQTRMRCTVNEVHQFHCGLLSRGEAGRYVLLSKRVSTAFDLYEGDEVEVELAADESKYGLPVPVEWEEILLFDEPAAKSFEALTPGRKRSVLHLVASAKREATRIDRALRIADNLKKGVTDPRDFLK